MATAASDSTAAVYDAARFIALYAFAAVAPVDAAESWGKTRHHAPLVCAVSGGLQRNNSLSAAVLLSTLACVTAYTNDAHRRS